jgi:hypothetical protein
MASAPQMPGYLNFDGGTAQSCGNINIYAFNGSTINARSATATGGGASGGGNVLAAQGSTINAADLNDAVVGNAGGIDYCAQASSASTLNLDGAMCRRLGATSVLDIVVNNGSTINAASSTGGVSQTVNTITAEGIIFK